MISSTKIKRQNGEESVYSPNDMTRVTHIRKNGDGTFSVSSDNGSTWQVVSPLTFLALNVSYDNGTSSLIATDVQSAIDELAGSKADKGISLADYGILDAYTKSETYSKGQVDGLVAQVASQAFPLIEEYKDVIFDGVISPAEFNVIPINGTYAVLSGGSLTGTPLVLNKYTDGVSDGLNLLVENRQSIIVNTDDPETALTELTEYYVLHEQWVALSIDLENFYNKADIGDLLTLDTESKTVVGAINEINSGKQNKNDNGLTTDSKAIVGAINEVNELAKLDYVFDTIIRTQDEFEEMIADSNWNGAKRVLIIGKDTDYKVQDPYVFHVPGTVVIKGISGISGRPIISIESVIEISFGGTFYARIATGNGVAGIYPAGVEPAISNITFKMKAFSSANYEITSFIYKGYGIKDCYFNITDGATIYPMKYLFKNCKNIENCLISNTALNYRPFEKAFDECENLSMNIIRLRKNGSSQIGFNNCENLIGNYVTSADEGGEAHVAYKDCSYGSNNRAEVNRVDVIADNCTKWSSSNDQ